MPTAVALDSAIFNKGLAVQVNDSGTDSSCCTGPAERCNQKDQVPSGISGKCCKYNQRDQSGEHNKNINYPVKKSSWQTTECCQNSKQRTEHQRQQTADQADEQGIPRSVNDLSENIITERVCPEQMLRRRGKPREVHLLQTEASKTFRKQCSPQENKEKQKAENKRSGFPVTQFLPPI